MKYSIIIPTYNHCDDFLRPCIESIAAYTTDFETIIIANGCTDNTNDYVQRLSATDHRFKFIWSDEPLGYTKATNLGIKEARGEYVILLNNDTVLLPQPMNHWIDLLRHPFEIDDKIGVTGPVKFSWQLAGLQREAMAFWLVMIPRRLFDEIGLLDEVYSPGMGEDGDFCIRAVEAGYDLVSVPTDVVGEFEIGLVDQSFPIWHAGNGTFADQVDEKNAIIERNNKILAERFGLGPYFVPNGYQVNKPSFFNDLDNTDEFQNEVYQRAHEIAINNSYHKILDIGCGSAYKLKKFFSGFNTIGVDRPEIIGELVNRYPHDGWITYIFGHHTELPDELRIEFDLVICSDVIEHLVDPDELFQFIKKLKFKHLVLSTPDRRIIEKRNGSRLGPPSNVCHIREWTMWELKRYLENSGFKIEDHYISNEAQATQVAICSLPSPLVSIVIPTYNHYEDAFKPCIEAVLKYTDLSNKEVIVVANGCKPDDLTRTHLEKLAGLVRYVWIDKPAGYIGAVNAGIDASLGKYIVLLDNDSHLLEQPVDYWINILYRPFIEQDKVGATSPFANEYEDMGFVLHSGCTMYDAELLRRIKKFDTIYMPGYFSDSDVSMKIWNAGYRCVEVPTDRAQKDYKDGMFKISFPVIHTGEVMTMDKNVDIEILKRNREILYSRYGKQKVKMNTNTNHTISIVIPTYNHCDDLLKPCIESIFKYTEMTNVELIVVANGCTDNTREYLDSLGDKVKTIWSDESLGYTKATNLGIKASTSEFVLLLNNDIELLEQTHNQWINMIIKPFLDDPTVGLSGPLMMHDDYADFDVIIFFCAMIRREVFDKIGLLDEIFSPGGGEDIDFAVRTTQVGYRIVPTTSTEFTGRTNVGSVPIWHKDNRTFREIPEYTLHIVKRNGLINAKRYNKNIKLDLGAGGIKYPGYLSVDLYDRRADIEMDITKLDFDDNSVVEIQASHVFEHLNPYHSIAILEEWKRVLKPDGKLIMEMPNIEKLCERFVTASTGERYGILNAIYGSVNTTGVGGPDNITSPHLFGWWPQSLHDHLTNAGYVDIQFMEEQIPHPESNLRVEAKKPLNSVNLPVITTFRPFVDHEMLKREEPGTFIELFEHNSYAVTENDINGKTVIDVGANLGMFALRCVELGAEKIICIEAQQDVYNFGLLRVTNGYPMIKTYHNAVYDVDGKTVLISNEHVGSRVNGFYGGDPVETITLKTLLIKENLLDADLVLKLDCEGSEFQILMNTEDEILRKFDVIFIEIHGNTNENPAYHDVEVARNRLREVNFKQVSIAPIMQFDENQKPVKEIGVYVEKWILV